jgi:predicted NUDIX family NTP pyrophosphohydrolase
VKSKKRGKTSAGLLLFRETSRGLEVLLVHPGGPFFAKKDLGDWSIPKGEIDGAEELLAAAYREMEEETGFEVERGGEIPLGQVTQKNGKVVHAWAVRGEADVSRLRSNEFEMEWPRGSGRMRSFPEVDRAEWFSLDEARRRIKAAQERFLDTLLERLQARK